jgi:hypothetical protein
MNKEEFIKIIKDMGFHPKYREPNVFVKRYNYHEPIFDLDPVPNATLFLYIVFQDGVTYIGYDSYGDATIRDTTHVDYDTNKVSTKLGIERFINKYLKKRFLLLEPEKVRSFNEEEAAAKIKSRDQSLDINT